MIPARSEKLIHSDGFDGITHVHSPPTPSPPDWHGWAGNDEPAKHEDEKENDPAQREPHSHGPAHSTDEPKHPTSLLLDQKQQQKLLEESASLRCVPCDIVGHAHEDANFDQRHRDAQQHHS